MKAPLRNGWLSLEQYMRLFQYDMGTLALPKSKEAIETFPVVKWTSKPKMHNLHFKMNTVIM